MISPSAVDVDSAALTLRTASLSVAVFLLLLSLNGLFAESTSTVLVRLSMMALFVSIGILCLWIFLDVPTTPENP
jgi:hypothetical protein